LSSFDVLAAGSRKRTLVMGVINVTPDSFYDGSKYQDPGQAIRHAQQMALEGADILDLGGQSTRPGAQAVDAGEELARVLPLARLLKSELPRVPWSIDTQKSEVAAAALDMGACLINDVSALQADPAMAGLAARAGCGLALMHWPDPWNTLTVSTRETRDYGPEGVVEEVKKWLLHRVQIAREAGVEAGRVWIDPGFGFGKSVGDNLALLKGLQSLTGTGQGVLLGTSRKSTLGAVLGNLPAEERLEATEATVALAAWMGAACVRVHDVKETVRVVKTIMAIKEAK
jgi:dihydropteroate synthase